MSKRCVVILAMLLVVSTGNTQEPPTVKELFNSGKLTFGYRGQSDYLCDPIRDSKSDENLEMNLREVWRRTRTALDAYVPTFEAIPIDSLPISQKAWIGDSLEFLIPEGNRTYAIDAVGIYIGDCVFQAAYRLIESDSTLELLPWGRMFLAMTDRSITPTNVKRIYTFDSGDEDINALQDSISSTIRQRHSTEMKHPKEWPIQSITFALYSSNPEKLSDTLLLTVKAFYGNNVHVWNAVYRLTRTVNGWDQTALFVLQNRGSPKWVFDYVTDLNGDGVLEYIVQGYASVAIFNIADGKLVQVISSGYRGC